MKFEIDFPTDEEIEQQKNIILQKAFPEQRIRRLGIREVFYQCKMTVLISLLIYFILMFFCGTINLGNNGFIVLAIFPLTYFSFYFLSLFAEEQSEVIQLKQSMRYSFLYLINLRMFYANLMAIVMNIILLVTCFMEFNHAWSLCAAGTSSTLLLALISLVSYEKTGTKRFSAMMVVVWIIGCVVLLKYGSSFYHLLIEVIPFAVHIAAAFFSLCLLINYMRKVEKKYAYSF
jgi:hypothetical protein